MKKMKRLAALVLACVLAFGVVSFPVNAETEYKIGDVADKAPDQVIEAFVNFGWRMLQKTDPPGLACGYDAGKKELYVRNSEERYVYLALGYFVDYHSNKYLSRVTSGFPDWQNAYNNSQEITAFKDKVIPAVEQPLDTSSADKYFRAVFYAYCLQKTILQANCPDAFKQMDAAVNGMTQKTALPAGLVSPALPAWCFGEVE